LAVGDRGKKLGHNPSELERHFLAADDDVLAHVHVERKVTGRIAIFSVAVAVVVGVPNAAAGDRAALERRGRPRGLFIAAKPGFVVDHVTQRRVRVPKSTAEVHRRGPPPRSTAEVHRRGPPPRSTAEVHR